MLVPKTKHLYLFLLLPLLIFLLISIYQSHFFHWSAVLDQDIMIIYNSLLISSGIEQEYRDHPGYTTFVIYGFFIKAFSIINPNIISNINDLINSKDPNEDIQNLYFFCRIINVFINYFLIFFLYKTLIKIKLSEKLAILSCGILIVSGWFTESFFYLRNENLSIIFFLVSLIFQIKFFESGKEHGTITAVINEQNYEITSLRKDVDTDGRHAKVEFTSDWKEDSKRRDFTINAIYSDSLGNLFDPQNGKLDLEKGILKFIGDPEKRIQEDYLRILRYFRFHINYSNENHKTEIIKIFKKNIKGISNLSSERLLDEFKKIVKSKNFLKLFEDQQSLEILEIVFPQFKNINHFKKLNSFSSKVISNFDIIFVIALLIIDETDNTDYFIYKFKISKKDQKRLKLIHYFFKEKVNIKSFTEKNFNKIFYYNGRQTVIDIINFKLFYSSKVQNKLLKLLKIYENKTLPELKIGANILMSKYKIPEGKILGNKLKLIEETWVQNGFQISDKQVEKIVKS